MKQLYFQPIKGKSLAIIGAILQTEDVASVGSAWGIISVVVEELVLNIVDYSNSSYLGVDTIRDEKSITLRFHDGGVPFNPLDKEPPDTSQPMEDREIGGLGIFLVVNKMDSVEYVYTNGENVLTVSKSLEMNN